MVQACIYLSLECVVLLHRWLVVSIILYFTPFLLLIYLAVEMHFTVTIWHEKLP